MEENLNIDEILDKEGLEQRIGNEELAGQICEIGRLIAEKTKNLPDYVRSKIYSRIQNNVYILLKSNNPRYKMYINSGTAGSFTSKEINNRRVGIVFLLDGLVPNKHVLLHEILHSLTYEPDKILNYKNDVGFRSMEKEESYNKKTSIEFITNKGLNEGATEFYTLAFSGDTNYASAYLHYVQIYNILSNACGFEDLMATYFDCDTNEFKFLIKQAFKLPNDYLVDKLLAQMDASYNEMDVTGDTLNNDTITKNCYETLVAMQVNKIREDIKDEIRDRIKNELEVKYNRPLTEEEIENIQIPQDEFQKKFNEQFKNFDIVKFLSNDPLNINNYKIQSDITANNVIQYVAYQIAENKDKFLDEYNDENYEIGGIKSMTVDILEAISQKDEDEIKAWNEYAGVKKLDVLRELNNSMFCDRNGIFKGQECLAKVFNHHTIRKYLDALCNKETGKIDLSGFNDAEKTEFISLVISGVYSDLVNPVQCVDNPCQYFSHNDLLEYFNTNKNAYKILTGQSFVKSESVYNDDKQIKAIQYLKPIIPQLNKEILQDENFQRLLVKEKEEESKCLALEDEFKEFTEEEMYDMANRYIYGITDQPEETAQLEEGKEEDLPDDIAKIFSQAEEILANTNEEKKTEKKTEKKEEEEQGLVLSMN